MEEKMFVIPGMFVPCNDTVTLLTYKRLKYLNLSFYVYALSNKEDQGIKEQLGKDRMSSKFKIDYCCDYDKTITISNPFLLPIGLINMQRYIMASYRKFKEGKYRYVYTSSIPGICHICGYKIKKNNPDIQWYASFSDPIKGSPYKKDPNLKTRSIFYRIAFEIGSYIYMNNRYEEKAIEFADKLVFICKEQRDFTANQYPDKKDSILARSIIMPLCYDEDWDMYKNLINCIKVNNMPKQAVHLGRIYGLRRIDTFLEALKELKEEDENLEKKIVFHQYSEIQKEDVQYITENNLNDLFVVHEKVPYKESLEIMKKADILVLFDTLMEEEPIQPYLPSKIVEYLILRKDILGICGGNSPSYRILNEYGFDTVGCTKEEIKKNILYLITESHIKSYSIDSLNAKNHTLNL